MSIHLSFNIHLSKHPHGDGRLRAGVLPAGGLREQQRPAGEAELAVDHNAARVPEAADNDGQGICERGGGCIGGRKWGGGERAGEAQGCDGRMGSGNAVLSGKLSTAAIAEAVAAQGIQENEAPHVAVVAHRHREWHCKLLSQWRGRTQGAEIGVRQSRADSQGQNGSSNYGLHTIGKSPT
jgi:hypothetical protein